MNTVTGRFKNVLSNIEDVPKGTSYMVTTNRAQLATAIKAVDPYTHTIIEPINAAGKKLCRYTFPASSKEHLPGYYEKHYERLARAVMKTPASIWR